MELKEGHHLEFEADAILETGKEHAKQQGGVAVGFRHLQSVTVGDNIGEFDEQEPEILRGAIETDRAKFSSPTSSVTTSRTATQARS
ncbi:MAG: hypothetical protein A07HN63_00026 [uncultured archaeon A07HN63]|nr:MAG: hypothetical protein A07HN63_00026 [uncultured archaeon A07HN63]